METLHNPTKSEKSNSIDRFMEALAGDDAMTRERAREELVRLGGSEVTRALVGALMDSRQQVRWEAAKALVAVADPVAAPALLHALEDEDSDVRWVAAEGLVSMRKVGLLTVLSGLTRRARSIEFCHGAHHVLHDLKKRGHADVIEPVLAALEQSEPAVAVPPTAYTALQSLEQGARSRHAS
jgi:hypothetical protein